MANQGDGAAEADSIRSQDPHMEEKKKTKSRRPASELPYFGWKRECTEERVGKVGESGRFLTMCADTAFRQQRLKAWQ